MDKDKIFLRLKQDYAHLGLGDAILQAQAESLIASGLVTDENLDSVILAQKPFLENLQKFNDKRATDAVAKAKAEFEKERLEAEKKAEEEAKRKAEEEAKRQAEEEAKKLADEEAKKNMPEWYIKEKDANKQFTEELKSQINELIKANTTLSEGINSLKQENDTFKAEKAKAEKNNFILTKAKELGIPQYRIDEGFVIDENVDEQGITEILSKVADNVKANALPNDRHFPLDNNKPSDKEISDLASNLVGF